jgi:uncharacterized protein (DUF433 family)
VNAKQVTDVDVSTEHIEIVEGARGPKPCIRGTRIRVRDVVGWYYELKWSADEIIEQIPHIAHADIFAALAYYWDHRDELDQKWAADDAWVDEMMRLHPGRLQEKLKQRRVG